MRIFFSIAIALAGWSCSSINAMRTPQPLPDHSPMVTIDPSMTNKNSAPVTINHAEQVGDLILLDVSYSGGCETHAFDLASRGEFTATYPPEVEIVLKHNSNDDRCRALVDDKLYFDLRPLQYQGTNRVLLVVKNTNKTLIYTY